jgi:signal transduction histidine kinase
MRARAESLGGSLIIDSSAASGTKVTFEMPRGEGSHEKESSS